MKRFGVKAVGLGVALAAGSALASDDWRSTGDPPAEVISARGPGLLPPSVRAQSPAPDAPIWVSANPPVMAPPARAVGEPPPAFVPQVGPALGPPVGGPFGTSEVVPAAGGVPAGPRVATGVGDPFGGLPDIPVVAAAPVPSGLPDPPYPRNLPPIPAADGPPHGVAARHPGTAALPAPRPYDAQPQPLPQPKPADPPADPPVMPQPRPVEWPPDPPPMPRPVPPGTALPSPRPVEVPAGAELPPAPPELMHPVGGVVGKHATFGSAPIRISRDFPPLSDVVHPGRCSDFGCADGAAGGDGGDGGPFNRFFVRGEYLLWWLPGYATPVLGTTNANTALNGYLGEPGTRAIFGPGPVVDSMRHGFRLRAGMWFDCEQSCGIDAGFFFLGQRSGGRTLGSDQFPLITRPVFVPNVVPGTTQPLGEAGESVAVPGILRGTLAVNGTSSLWGADVNLRHCLLNVCDEKGTRRAEWFAGYRYLNLRESLTITENITVIGPGGDRIFILDPVGTRVFVQDRFQTRNSFHGGQLGVNYAVRRGSWEWDTRASVALGGTHQELQIDGVQVRNVPGATAPMTFAGGLVAAGPNLGRFSQNRFSVVPELGVNVGYWVTPGFRVYAGYNLLFWSNVIRPGDQIDRVVDATFVPNSLPNAPFSGQNRPRPLFKQSDVTIQGVQFGLEWRW